MQKIILFLLIFTGLWGCQNKKAPSILIVSIENLASTDVLCTSQKVIENPHSGFHVLCKEAVRFTHAHTPSTLAVPTLASLLTAQYPFQHEVQHNGQYLALKLVTSAEVAVQKNYRTSFFSSGAPILRKTNLHQGFEVFDDHISLSIENLYQSAPTTFEKFYTWQKNISSDSFFSFIYLSDLIFTHIPTLNAMGEVRNFSGESQLEELDENLYSFFNELKKKKIWDQTFLIVLGTKGHPSSLDSASPEPLILESENTQVALFIKPPNPPRDESLSWKVDRNVSLVDVGETLFSILNTKAPPPQKEIPDSFKPFSLKSSLEKIEQSLPANRTLMVESSWALWRADLPTRFAFIKDPFIWVHDANEKIYNTLNDPMETIPLKMNKHFKEEFKDAIDFVNIENLPAFPSLKKVYPFHQRITYEDWMREDRKKSLNAQLKNFSQGNSQLHWKSLYLRSLLEVGELNTLKSQIVQNQREDLLWLFSRSTNSEIKIPLSRDPCEILLNKEIRQQDFKSCPDDLWNSFISWTRAKELGLDTELQRSRFEQKYWYHSIDMKIAKAWIATDLIWDVNPQLSWDIHRADLALQLPRWAPQKTQVENSMRFLNTLKRDSESLDGEGFL